VVGCWKKKSIAAVMKPAVDIFAYGCTIYEMVAAPGPRRLFNPLTQKGCCNDSSSNGVPAANYIYTAIATWVESYTTTIVHHDDNIDRRHIKKDKDTSRLRARLALAGVLRAAVVAACHPQPAKRQLLT
jgi:hypothetical protein